MNRKYEMINMLLKDAKEEHEKVERYDHLMVLRVGDDVAAAKAADIELDHMRVPSRKRVRDAMQMIRQITLDIERGL